MAQEIIAIDHQLGITTQKQLSQGRPETRSSNYIKEDPSNKKRERENFSIIVSQASIPFSLPLFSSR
jgi:hypothetical protein